jgi:AbiTii
MSLLHDIQTAILQENAELGPILLKLRLLAARLGSQPLADWVKHESEGYPNSAALPGYRILSVSYLASFAGPFGSGIQNAPISPYLIQKFAGASWVRHEVRQSIAAVDELLRSSAKAGALGIDASNLMHLLQGNVYPDYNCTSVAGKISRAALAELHHAVRSRVLELTIGLEQSIPEASSVSIGPTAAASSQSSATATQIAQQIIYGNVTSISTTGDGTRINVAVSERDIESLVKFLIDGGLAEVDARQLGQIVASEEPESKVEPFGTKAKRWLVDNLKKAADGTWKVGVSVATDLVKEAALKYYGLK